MMKSSKADEAGTQRLQRPDQSDGNLPTNGHDEYFVVSKSMRTYITYLLGLVTTLSTLTSTIYFPLIPLLSTSFATSIQAINLTVTVYAICQGVSPGIFASLADAFGRRPVLMVLILIYAAASLGLSLNKDNYAALITLRGLQSVGGSATPAIAYGIVADVAVPADRGGMLGPLMSTCNGISSIGPIIGGVVASSSGGYRWVFVALLGLAAACFLLIGSTLPETARNIVGNGSVPTRGIWKTWYGLIKKKEAGGSDDAQRSHGSTSWSPIRVLDSVRIIFEPDAALVLWMIGSSYSAYYTFQVITPVIFDQAYGYNELEIGLAFLPGLAGMTFGGLVAGILSDRNYRRTAKEQNVDPANLNSIDLSEFPIEAARSKHFIPAFALQTTLIIGYGWIVQAHVHPACPMVFQFLICGISTSISHPASTLLVDIYPEKSSTAYASGQVMRCGLSAIWAAVIQPLTDSVGRGWCLTIFSLIVNISGIAAVVASRTYGMRRRQNRRSGRS